MTKVVSGCRPQPGPRKVAGSPGLDDQLGQSRPAARESIQDQPQPSGEVSDWSSVPCGPAGQLGSAQLLLNAHTTCPIQSPPAGGGRGWQRHQRLGQCRGLCLSGRSILRESVLMLGACECPALSRPQLAHPEKEQAEPKASGDLCKSRVLGVPSSHAPRQPPCPVLAATVSDPKGSLSAFASLTSAGRTWGQMQLAQGPR